MLGNYTDINILLDASASMHPTKDLTRQSLVEFIQAQQLVPGQANVTLAEFHETGHFRYVYLGTPLGSFNPERLVYEPRGGRTALRDAWVRLMHERGQAYAALPEASRPNKVVFVIITDGQDNASASSLAAVRQMVDQQTNIYQWQFIYLGANQDAIAEASTYGLPKDFALTYDINSVKCATASASGAVSYYRQTGATRAFTEDERKKAAGKNNA